VALKCGVFRVLCLTLDSVLFSGVEVWCVRVLCLILDSVLFSGVEVWCVRVLCFQDPDNGRDPPENVVGLVDQQVA